jgi:hypothetical protein
MALLVLAVLAVYRIATDFAWEIGPLGLYSSMRGRAMQRFGKRDWVTEGVSCPICWSFWLSIPAALLVAPWDWTLILYWLGIAGAAAYLARSTSHDS